MCQPNAQPTDRPPAHKEHRQIGEMIRKHLYECVLTVYRSDTMPARLFTLQRAVFPIHTRTESVART